MNKQKQKIKDTSTDENSVIEDAMDQVENDTVTEIEQVKIDLAESQDKHTRLFAEFDNFKKRTAKERIELFSTANMDVMVSMIPVLDDFERAIIATQDTMDIEGYKLVFNKFKHSLENKGLTSLGTSAGDEFNVDLHEAITTIPAADEASKGKIVDVIEKGYKLGDKVIRYAKVVIGE